MRRITSKRSSIKAKRLLRKAYRLGFEVGYYKHLEGVGWVGDERALLMNEAREKDMVELVNESYKKGKEAGLKKRSADIRGYFYGRVKVMPKTLAPRELLKGELKAETIEGVFRRRIGVRKPPWIERPKAIGLPKHLAFPHRLRLPSFLRSFRFYR